MSEKKISNDLEILRLYQEGDTERALKVFIDEYQTRLYSIAYQMLGNHDDAMDALQEILIQVYRSLPTFKGQSSLYTWVYRLSSNVCLNFRTKRSRRSQQIEFDESLLQSVMLPVERPNEDPDKMCESKYKQFLVQQGILKLPETQRMIIVLHDIEGLSVPESAGILNITVNVAKSRLHRAREALRKIISKGFEVKGMEGVGMISIDPTGRLL
ncbi:RNA polymerase sigma factor [Pelosinus sp. sgz500959]|uniref:RNA polymerase sigma factor n=1 Tax=Pelosinus sp. sgz500959 TaxID=3242472 RepID=UPI0036711F43